MLLFPPVKPLIITSCFGPRPRPYGPMHPGVDCRCVYGQEIYAVQSGEVVRSYLSANDPPDWKAGSHPPPGWPVGKPYPKVMGYGETILILHADGTLSRYAHLAQRLVEAGQHVEGGQVIGHAGTTGYSFGVHLHFELRSDGGRSFIDPLPLLPDPRVL